MSKSGQSIHHSILETITNVVVGYVLAVLTQLIVFPLYGITTTFSQNAQVGIIFTVVSLIRSYVLRRIFNGVQGRS
jgi:hypothetical protein